MPSSPIVEVKDGAGPWVATTGGVDVTPGNTISIRLADSGPVTTWFLEIFGVDEVTASAPVLTGVNLTTHQVATPATVVTFTMPSGAGVGRALVFRSSVDSGGSGFSTTFGVYTLTGLGDRVGAVGEKFEGDPTFGWLIKVNPLIRTGGGGGPPSGAAGGDLGGTYPNPTVLKINGTSIPVTGVPDIGKSLTVTGAGTATWQTVAFTAGGDLSGTPTSQTVEKVKGTTVTTAGGALTPGHVLKVTGVATADWQAGFTAGGDLSGTDSSQTVEKVKGTTVTTTGGALTTGYVLKVTGPATADWQPDAGFTAGGDLSGTSSSQTVEKVKGTTVTTAGGALTTGYALVVTGPATADWQAIPAGFTAGGDLSGTPTSQTVEKVKGTTITTAGGALTTGHVLKVTGPATADWSAVSYVPETTEIVLVAGIGTVDNGTTARVGQRILDLTPWPATLADGRTRTVTLYVNVEVTAGTLTFQLYNETDAENVTLTPAISTTSLANVEFSRVLTVGVAAGNLKTNKSYQAQISLSGGGGTDIGTCTNARLVITYA